MAPDAALSRAWLAACVAGRPLATLGLEVAAEDLVAQARSEGLVALVGQRLQQATRSQSATQIHDSSTSVQALTQAFTKAARDDALTSMVIEGEARRVLAQMAEAGIHALLLKGSALAHWAYEQPHLRAAGDVDLLLASREAAEQLSARLTAHGYERADTSGELVAYELLCTRAVTPDWKVEIDIHWRLANSPLFSSLFSFDELMADSMALPRLAPHARGLGPVHALLHACIHRALNLSIGVDDKLKWLYDLIVLMDVFTPADWARMVHLAVEKKMAGVVFSGLQAAGSTFGRELPADAVAALSQAAAMEPLDATRLADWGYMQRKTWAALPGLGLRLRWLWQRVFPSRDYLEYLYGEQPSYAALMLARFRRAVQRLRG